MSDAIPRKPPAPVAVTFLPCSEILNDQRTGCMILLSPLGHVKSVTFPAIFKMAVWAELTGARGEYEPQLQLLGPKEEIVWGSDIYPPWKLDDPLTTQSITFFDLSAVVPHPGRYRLVLLLNGMEVAQRAISVAAVRHPQE